MKTILAIFFITLSLSAQAEPVDIVYRPYAPRSPRSMGGYRAYAPGYPRAYPYRRREWWGYPYAPRPPLRIHPAWVR